MTKEDNVGIDKSTRKEKETIDKSKTRRRRRISVREHQDGVICSEYVADVPLSLWELLAAGGLSGVLGRGVPLIGVSDRVRYLYQVNAARQFTIKSAFKTTRRIVETSGVSALWRGQSAAMWRVMPYSAIQLTAFDKLTSSTYSYPYCNLCHGTTMDFAIAGGISGVMSAIVTYPFDVVRGRMATHWQVEAPYFSTFRAMVEIQSKEGTRELFRGALWTCCGTFVYTGIGFSFFHAGKLELRELYEIPSDADIPLAWRFGLGTLAGLVAQMITYPLATVRKRVQASNSTPEQGIGAFKSILRTEGVRKGLYKGASLSILRGPFSVGVALSANDYIKSHLTRLRDDPLIVPIPEEILHVNYDLFRNPAQKPQITSAEVRKISAIENLICGGIAGSIAKTVIAPFDRVKILYQTNTERIFSYGSAIKTGKHIWEVSGVPGLFRGHAATLLAVAPRAGITFTLFPRFRDELEPHFSSPTTSRFLAGSISSACSSTFTYPLDMLRARMAAHWSNDPLHMSYMSAVTSMVKKNGVRSLFQGLRPTLLGIVPYSGTSFMLFETLKPILSEEKEDGSKNLPIHSRLCAGAFAGLVAQSLTYPLDIIRRRMQVHYGLYRNELHAFRTIYATEGRRGLFKGLSMNWFKGPISIAIAFTTNDLLQEALVDKYG